MRTDVDISAQLSQANLRVLLTTRRLLEVAAEVKRQHDELMRLVGLAEVDPVGTGTPAGKECEQDG